jgi:hypothetical protein
MVPVRRIEREKNTRKLCAPARRLSFQSLLRAISCGVCTQYATPPMRMLQRKKAIPRRRKHLIELSNSESGRRKCAAILRFAPRGAKTDEITP